MKTEIQITKKQAIQLMNQLKQDINYYIHESKTDFYYSFLSKKGNVNITIYEFDKKYYLQITSLS